MRNSFTNYTVNSIDPYVNQLLELSADVVKGGTTSCCDRYISAIKNLYKTPVVNDTEPPKIKTTYYSEVTATSFRLCCVPTDNVGVSSVKMATWTTGDQSDIKWIDARNNGSGTWFVDFNRNDYKNKILFITHVYVYDAAGNHCSKECNYTYDTTPPGIDKIYYSEKKPDSFRICVVPKDMKEISKVQIATWTTGDQSDIKWYDARNNGVGTWFVDHSEKDFTNNKLFVSHVFVYDKSGNKTSSEQFYYPDNTNPEINDIEITEISKTGYKISCKVTDNDLQQVKFPTWTTGDQSDIIWHEGTIEDDTAYCYIKRSDHGDRLGYYITHVYAYDGTGNKSSKEKKFLYNTAAICAANGHDYQVVSTKEPTCTEEGKTEYKCTVCNDELTVSIMPTQVHDYGTWTKKDDKVHQRVCKHNANHVETEAHKWDSGNVTKAATENEAGIMTYKCTACEATKSEIIPALNHSHSLKKTAEKEATCTESGNIEYWTCADCGRIFSDSKCSAELKAEDVMIAATGHKIEVKNKKDATCTENGYSGDEVCKVCGDMIKKGSDIPAKGHSAVNDTAVEPTATSTGLTAGSHCYVCGTVLKKQEIIPKRPVGQEPTTEQQTDTKPATASDPDHPDVKEQEKKITNQIGDADPAGSTYVILSARVTKSKKTTNTLKWNKVKGASGYIIYGNRCGTKFRFEKIAEVNKTSYVHKSLKKGTYYKYLIVAYKSVFGNKTVLATSKTMHAATIGGKVGNCRKLKLYKNKVTLKRKKTFKIKAKEMATSKKLKIKKHRKIAFESSNPKVATVTKAGKIKGLRKGSCKIYVYAQNGIYKTVTVRVK